MKFVDFCMLAMLVCVVALFILIVIGVGIVVFSSV
jgi:hypothetical protein